VEEAPVAFDELEPRDDDEALDEDSAESGTSDDNETGDEDLIEIDLDDLGINLDSDALLDESKDAEELKQLRVEGAVPMTPAPEDTTYLEEAAATESSEDESSFDISFEDNGSFDSTSLDLSEAVIDEPDLSAGIVENPVVEPTLEEIEDSEFDIGALEDLSDAGSEVDNLDIDIDLPKGDDDIVGVIPEGFEAAIEETPVSLDDDLDIDIPVESAETTDVALETEESKASGVIGADGSSGIPSTLKNELKNVLSYLDQLLESLPEEKIEEFAKSEHFDAYKKIFKELGLA